MSTPFRRNVPVTLWLNDVNGHELVEAISAHTGVTIELMRWEAVRSRLPQLPSPEMMAKVELKYRRLDERTSVHWEGVPLADVLRDVAARFGVSGHTIGGVIRLSPQDEPRSGRPPHGVEAFENSLVRMYPRFLSVTSTRSRWFIRELAEAEGQYERDQLYICLTCEYPGEDADRIAGIRNLVALDDRGKRLEARTLPDEWEFHSNADLGVYPDEWEGRLVFPAPSLDSRKLVSMDGDLMLFEEYQTFRIEFPLPLVETVREVGPVSVEVLHYDPDEAAPVHPREPPRLRGGRGPQVKAVIRKPVGAFLSSLGEYGQVAPVLIGATGTLYTLRPGGTGLSRSADQECELEADFEPEDDRPARLIFDLALKSRPAKLCSFSLRDIPLP